jgi:hypothetical protein
MAEKTWNQKQQIRYEYARDVISSLEAILLRHTTKTTDSDEIQKCRARIAELGRETQNFNGFDDDIVELVIDTYTPLLNDYRNEPHHDRLNEKYLNTKVDYEPHR